jgi:hypothetical protein
MDDKLDVTQADREAAAAYGIPMMRGSEYD